MKNRFLLIIAVAVASLIAISCGGGSSSSSTPVNPSATTVTPSASMSLANVNQLMVAPVGLASAPVASLKDYLHKTLYALLGISNAVATNAPNNQAYSIDPSGKITPSNVADLIAGTTSSATSNWVMNTPSFILFSYNGLYQPINNNTSSQQCVLVGVRKSDGRFACITQNPRCDAINNCSVTNYRSQLKVDPSGNIFYMVLGDGGLERIDLTNPSSPVTTAIFSHAAVGDAGFPVVNSLADVVTGVNINSGPTVEYRLYDGAGSLIYTAQESNINCIYSGAGSNASSFYYTYIDQAATNSAPSGTFYIKKLSPSNGRYLSSTIYSIANSPSVYLGSGCTNVVQNQGNIYAINWYNPDNPTSRASLNLAQFPQVNGDVTTYYPLEASSPIKKDLQSYTGGLVILGDTANSISSSIERFNLGIAQTVLPIGAYSISSIAVDAIGNVKFTGVRILDGVGVLGTLNAANQLTVQVLSVQPVSIAPVTN